MEIKNIKDVFDVLNKYEKSNKVFSVLLLKKIPIWAYFRTNLAEFMYVKYNLAESVAPKRTFTLSNIFNTILYGFKGFFILLKKRKADFWFFETSRRYLGKEPYCQPIYDGLDKRSYNKFCYSEKWSYESKIIYINFIKLLIMATSISLSPLLSLFLKKSKINILNKTIKDILGDNSFSYNQKYIECFLWYYYFYFLMKINKPKKVFIVSNTFFIPLIAICDKYGIETIEIQHGIISKYCVNYNFKGLNRKWFFPNTILLLGEDWRGIKDFLPENANIKVLGSVNVIKNKKKENGCQKVGVLFISQKPIRNYVLSFLNHYESVFINYKIIFKLHPMEYNLEEEIFNNISKNLQGNVTLIKDEKGINELNNEVKCQIGVYSNAILEGVQVNLPTLLIKTPLSNHLDFLQDLNIKMSPISSDELLDFLKSEVQNYNVEYFSEFKNSVKNEVVTI